MTEQDFPKGTILIEIREIYDGWSVAALQQPQWISIKDRLPEHLESVYVYMGNREIDKYSCQTYAKDGGFSNNYGITHWMPLPIPPTSTEEK